MTSERKNNLTPKVFPAQQGQASAMPLATSPLTTPKAVPFRTRFL